MTTSVAASTLVCLVIGCMASGLAGAQPPVFETELRTGTVVVAALSKQLEPAAHRDDFMSVACRDWTLAEADVLFFFRHAQVVTSEVRQLSYLVLPCKYTGSLAVGNTLYRFEINAGQFGFIFGPPEVGTRSYGCLERCARLFPFDADGDFAH